MQPFLAQILLLTFYFSPKGWALCAGQIMAINQNQALFSLLGTTYGGNGIQTFQLPDLRGRVPVHPGQGPGLPNYILGEVAGTETITLLSNQLPSHTHPLKVNNAAPNAVSPNGAALAQSPMISGNAAMVYSASSSTTLAANAVANAGGNQPLSILQPFSVLNYSIALQGIFPTRN